MESQDLSGANTSESQRFNGLSPFDTHALGVTHGAMTGHDVDG
jgi:hypothetical protein